MKRLEKYITFIDRIKNTIITEKCDITDCRIVQIDMFCNDYL